MGRGYDGGPGINATWVGRLLSMEGWGDRDESFKRGVSQGRRGAPPITATGRSGGQIMLMCPQTVNLTTPNPLFKTARRC